MNSDNLIFLQMSDTSEIPPTSKVTLTYGELETLIKPHHPEKWAEIIQNHQLVLQQTKEKHRKREEENRKYLEECQQREEARKKAQEEYQKEQEAHQKEMASLMEESKRKIDEALKKLEEDEDEEEKQVEELFNQLADTMEEVEEKFYGIISYDDYKYMLELWDDIGRIYGEGPSDEDDDLGKSMKDLLSLIEKHKKVPSL
jgi:DNA repair exonuclease SbcCD ATPase subunit